VLFSAAVPAATTAAFWTNFLRFIFRHPFCRATPQNDGSRGAAACVDDPNRVEHGASVSIQDLIVADGVADHLQTWDCIVLRIVTFTSV
jgi:hypothetical protein